ncbi:MAG: aldehyde:ferredoxin oxidoreductase [Thermoplasmata archaeon]|nr:MAG: aldehyde:ferredoxin oxidoreductase [Thermoplasmata archaeon]
MAEFGYELRELDKGYNDRTLYVNLSEMLIESKPVSDKMKELFVGGKGFDLWLLWNGLPKDRVIKWNDEENELCIACGPLGGTPLYPGSGKSIVASISPLTHLIMDSNVGGHFGPFLKFAGWDALEIQGKAPGEVVIFIDGTAGKVTIESAEGLPSESHLLADELTKKYGGEDWKRVSVVSSGPGADNTNFGCLNFSWYDAPKKKVRYKQAGRGGLGTVLRDKKIRALVARSPKFDVKTNHPADLERLKEVGREHSNEIRTLDPKQNEMAIVGTTHLIPIMNEFDLLPVNNFKFGSHPLTKNIGSKVYREKFVKGFDGCWVGCSVACSHGIADFVPKTGPFSGQKVFVDGPEYETIAGVGSNCGIFDPDVIAEINFYCDTYGLDTISTGTSIAFAMECYEMGLIDNEATGGLTLKFGNSEATLEVIHQMAKGESFGKILGQGIRSMKKLFAEKYGADPKILQDIGMEAKGLEYSEYVTKESLAQQGGYGLALKGPQHDEAWLIFLDMVHKLMPTFEQKAEALHWFPMFRTWFGLCGLCKLPWNDIVPEDNKETPEPAKVMKHVNWYAKYFSTVTGRQSSADDLIRMSERVYNFERIFNIRLGFGRREDDRIPYRSMGPVTVEEYESRVERYDKQFEEILGLDPKSKSTEEKMQALRKYKEDSYESLKDAVYKRRGWDSDGVPTLEKVKELGIDFPEVVKLITEQ